LHNYNNVQNSKPITIVEDTHRQRVMIDFVQVMRLNCACHLLSASIDLAGLLLV